MSGSPGASKPADGGFDASRPTWVRWQLVLLMMGYSFLTWFNRKSISVAVENRFNEKGVGGNGFSRDDVRNHSRLISVVKRQSVTN